eukprot:TRINITY_DN4034_c0_g1_i4.p1 TRINITY_DN4034_c0_g1~~TRINITY_DN4034_c0_g1_i4.p1  ORF type:complete len:1514 (-),score=449.67 TRINITY_DN4034_c0_g1_i4:136-4677(-)
MMEVKLDLCLPGLSTCSTKKKKVYWFVQFLADVLKFVSVTRKRHDTAKPKPSKPFIYVPLELVWVSLDNKLPPTEDDDLKGENTFELIIPNQSLILSTPSAEEKLRVAGEIRRIVNHRLAALEMSEDSDLRSGVFMFNNVGKFEGKWFKGQMHGEGTFISFNGDKYEGQWHYLMKAGYGLFISESQFLENIGWEYSVPFTGVTLVTDTIQNPRKRPKLDDPYDDDVLTKKDLELILSPKFTTLLQYDVGSIILKEGERLNQLFRIQSGEVWLIKNIKGEKRILEIMKPYQMFGFKTLFDLPAHCNFVTASDCEIYVIDVNELYRSFNEDTSKRFNLHLARSLASQLTNQRLEDGILRFLGEDAWEGEVQTSDAEAEEWRRTPREREVDSSLPPTPRRLEVEDEDRKCKTLFLGQSPKASQNLLESLEKKMLVHSNSSWGRESVGAVLDEATDDFSYKDPFCDDFIQGKTAFLKHHYGLQISFPQWNWLQVVTISVSNSTFIIQKCRLALDTRISTTLLQTAMIWLEYNHFGFLKSCEILFDAHKAKKFMKPYKTEIQRFYLSFDEEKIRKSDPTNGSPSVNRKTVTPDLDRREESHRPRSKSMKDSAKPILVLPSVEDNDVPLKRRSVHKEMGEGRNRARVKKEENNLTVDNIKPKKKIRSESPSPTVPEKRLLPKGKKGLGVIHPSAPPMRNRNGDDRINPIPLNDTFLVPKESKNKTLKESPRIRRVMKRDKTKHSKDFKLWHQRFDIPEADRNDDIITEFQCYFSSGGILPSFTSNKRYGTLYVSPKYLCYFSGFLGMSSKEVISIKAITTVKGKEPENLIYIKMDKKRALKVKSRYNVTSSVTISFPSSGGWKEALLIIEELCSKCEKDDDFDISMECSPRLESWIQQTINASTLDKAVPNIELAYSKIAPSIRMAGPGYKDDDNVKKGDPEDEPPSILDEDVCALSVSTYPRSKPHLVDGNIVYHGRQGDPICDQYCLERFHNRTIFALADGCNWGLKVKKAAKAAAQTFVEYNKKTNFDIDTTRATVRAFLQSFVHAHFKIIEGHEESYWDCGTTTLLGGSILEVNDPTHKWAFLCLSLGDCKAFNISFKNDNISVTNITKGRSGSSILDAKDCGGRLGPFNKMNPDLRNLDVHFHFLEEGDYVLVVTDGVYDNMDPQSLGIPLSESNIPGLEGKTWKDITDIPNPELLDSVYHYKNNYITQKFESLLKELVEEQSLSLENVQCSQIAQKIINYCKQVTLTTRDYMEKNPNNNQPSSFKDFPGKVDHTTCLVIKVGKTTFRQWEVDMRDLLVRLRHPTTGLTIEGTQKEIFKGTELVQWVAKNPSYSKMQFDIGQLLLNFNLILPLTSSDSFMNETFHQDWRYQFKGFVPIMTQRDWNVIIQGTTPKMYKAGEVIITEDTFLQNIYQITVGICRIEKTVYDKVNSKPKVQKLGTIGPPQTMGEVSLLQGTKASATVIADTDVEVIILDRHFINIMFIRYPDMAGRFYHYLASVLARRLSYHESSIDD